jgi:hypothetical protein
VNTSTPMRPLAVADQGYTHNSIRQQIVVIADFSRWLKQKQIVVQDLDSNVVNRFLRHRHQPQRVRRGDPKTLQRLLTVLRQIGVVKPEHHWSRTTPKPGSSPSSGATCYRNAVCRPPRCSTTCLSSSSSLPSDFTTGLRTLPCYAHRTSPDSFCATRISRVLCGPG